jgi:hypothetical protein
MLRVQGMHYTMCLNSHCRDSLPALYALVAETVCRVERYLPSYLRDINLHEVVQLVQCIRQLGACVACGGSMWCGCFKTGWFVPDPEGMHCCCKARSGLAYTSIPFLLVLEPLRFLLCMQPPPPITTPDSCCCRCRCR